MELYFLLTNKAVRVWEEATKSMETLCNEWVDTKEGIEDQNPPKGDG